MSSEEGLPKREHLRRLDRLFIRSDAQIYFVTICSKDRARILTKPQLAGEIENILRRSKEVYGWAVGYYVIMPDHVHFFCKRMEGEKSLSVFVRDIKKWTAHKQVAEGYGKSIWQKEFFDRLLRDQNSYMEKCEYIKNNPVRAGLCGSPEEWPYQGEFVSLLL